jgi:hypothetical protein
VRPETIMTRNVNRGAGGTRISKEKYEIVREALLRAVPKKKDGIAFKDLPRAVAREITRRDLANLGSVTWYTTTVKLDLEARGILERVPGAKPQRIRRTGKTT